eukprot:364282-Chlamydomonas_euryale.AAC.57
MNSSSLQGCATHAAEGPPLPCAFQIHSSHHDMKAARSCCRGTAGSSGFAHQARQLTRTCRHWTEVIITMTAITAGTARSRGSIACTASAIDGWPPGAIAAAGNGFRATPPATQRRRPLPPLLCFPLVRDAKDDPPQPSCVRAFRQQPRKARSSR